MAAQSITFSGGMNKDTDKGYIKQGEYVDATNIRVTTTKGLSTGAVENIRGSKLLHNKTLDGSVWSIANKLPPYNQQGTDYKILGYCSVGDTLVVFSKNLVENQEASYIHAGVVDLQDETIINFHLVYSDIDKEDKLNFDENHLIKAIGRYETEHLQKVYWTDGLNETRYINIADPNVNNLTVDKLSFLPNVEFTTPYVTKITTGNIPTGVVYYAYQLYDKYGAETAISPLSTKVSVASSNSKSTNSKDNFGDLTTTNSGKGFVVTVDIPSGVDYNRIRLFRVYYESQDTTPAINIAAEEQVTGSRVSIVDTGDTYGEYTTDEFNLVNVSTMVCQDLEVKDNILFAAGISEKYVDIPDSYDCRAVRFNASNVASLDDGFVTITPTELSSDEAFRSVYPINADGINSFNELNALGDANKQYKYMSDGSTLGAEGPNLRIGFTTEPMTLDDNISNWYGCFVKSDNSNEVGSYGNYANSVKSGKACWQRDETYRIYIVFYNKRGQHSFPHWVCDLRMPSWKDSMNGTNYLSKEVDNKIETSLLYPYFELKNLPDGFCGYQIYRCRRTISDRTILTQGVVLPIERDWSGGDFYTPSLLNYEVSSAVKNGNLLYRCVYPELLYSKSEQFPLESSLLEVIGSHTLGSNYRTKLISGVNNHDSTDYINSLTVCKAVSMTPVSTDENKAKILEEQVIPFGSKDISPISNFHYRNWYHSWKQHVANRSRDTFYGSTSSMIVAKSLYNKFQGLINKYTPIVNYRVDNSTSIYGGITYESRYNDISMPCSDISYELNSRLIAYAGDTYICPFEVLSAIYPLDDMLNKEGQERTAYVNILHVPIETTININFQSSKFMPSHMFAGDYSSSDIDVFDPSLVRMTQEVAGNWESVTSLADGKVQYVQDEALYEYNPVYSQQPVVKEVSARDKDVDLIEKFPFTIKASGKKQTGEFSDSWARFGGNESIEVDSEYGKIYAIKNFSDKLFYFQEKGFGVAQVNPQSVIQDNNTSALVLGTGGVLQRFDYASTHCGCSDKFSVITTKAGMYWFDRLNKTVYRLSDGLSDLAMENKIESWFKYCKLFDARSSNNYVNEDLQYFYSIAAKDMLNGDILFSFVPTANLGNVSFTMPKTIVFNEILNAFMSQYSFVPSLYMQYKNRYIGVPQDKPLLCMHNSKLVPRCSFDGYFTSDPIPSDITVIVNDGYAITKVFDNIEYMSNTFAYDNNNNEIDCFYNTFDYIIAWDDYQNTGRYNLIYNQDINDTLKRRERSWTFAIPRNIVNKDVSTDPNIFDADNHTNVLPFADRMRDKYLLVKFVYNNNKSINADNTDIRFVCSNMTCGFRPSVR